MKFACSLVAVTVLALAEGHVVRRQVARPPIVPPVLPRVAPIGVNPLNDVPIISYVNENNFDGSYKYSFETGNGISVSEEGFLKNPGAGEELEAQSASGSYSYTAPDGQLVRVTWVADENGFRSRTGLGNPRLPVQPPVRNQPPIGIPPANVPVIPPPVFNN